jgi:ankyrin repeat protein
LLQASKGFVNILRQLLRAGAKVNAKDKTGSTPLHRAASAGKFDAALVLLEEGRARVDSHDKTGSTALLVAVACRESNIAILLASKGANLEVGWLHHNLHRMGLLAWDDYCSTAGLAPQKVVNTESASSQYINHPKL